MAVKLHVENPASTRIYGLTQVPIIEFLNLNREQRVQLFLRNLASQLTGASTPLANVQLLGPDAIDARHKLAILELETRFAFRERIGEPMTASLYAQVVLPLLSVFFINPRPTTDLVSSLTTRAIDLLGTTSGDELKAPCCNIVIRPL